jgi:hypothetical protein
MAGLAWAGPAAAQQIELDVLPSLEGQVEILPAPQGELLQQQPIPGIGGGTGEGLNDPGALPDAAPQGTLESEPLIPERQAETRVDSAPGALLRGLDKVSGETTDIPIGVGETLEFGYLTVTLEDCRFPADDPSSNAYALLHISEPEADKEWFTGWMIANAPALNPLDHPRYDVWALRCRTSAAETSGG